MQQVQEPRISSIGQLVTLVRAAEDRGIKYNTLYRWVRRNSIPTFRVGRTIVVSSEDIDKYKFGARS